LRVCFGSLVLSILSRWLIQFCLCLNLTSCIPEISSSFLTTSLLILSSLVYPLTLLRKRISAVLSGRKKYNDFWTILKRYARQTDVADGCHCQQYFVWNNEASDSLTYQHCSGKLSNQATLLEDISMHVDFLLGEVLSYGFSQSPYLQPPNCT